MSLIDIPTPEMDKIKAVQDQSQTIGEFLEWLSEEGFTICELAEDRDLFLPHRRSIEERLGDYFEIDTEEAERERQRILDAIRDQT